MRERNPRIVEALTRLAYLASGEVGYMEREAKESWGQLAMEGNGTIELDKAVLESLHPAIQRRLLRRAYARLAGDTRGLEQVHMEAMAKLVDAPPEKMTCLPRGLKLISGYTKLILTVEGGVPGRLTALEGEHPLDAPDPGETVTRKLPGWQVVLQWVANAEKLSLRDPFTAYIDLNRVGQDIWVRRRVPGDRFQPSGMESEKKLQDFFVDRKVPRSSRDAIPLVVSQRGIAWVVGHRVAEWARSVEGSLELLSVEFHREEQLP
jgi:tRNA(Ile)-lysidine synthase